MALPKLYLKMWCLPPQKNHTWLIWPQLRTLSRLHAYSAFGMRSRCYIFNPFGFGGSTQPRHCWWHQGPKTRNTVAQLPELGRVSWKLAFNVGFLWLWVLCFTKVCLFIVSRDRRYDIWFITSISPTPKEFLTGLPNACSTPLFWDQKEGPSFARSARRSFQQLLAVTWSSGSTHYCSKSTQPTWQDSILAWTFLAMRVLAWTFFRGK